MKRLITFLGVLCLLLLSSIGLAACNNDKSNNNNTQNNSNDINKIVYLPYEIDKTGRITRFYANESNSVNIVIPATYSIDENGKLISGTAYEIKAIGEYCFANNNLIESVFIPDTIISIEDRAFYNCANINTINITQNITNIGKDIFELCPQLNIITKNGKSGLILDENDNLSSFTIPNTITKLGDSSFANWEKLSAITIANNIDYVGDNAFANCSNLSRVSITSQLGYFGNNAFSNCEKLTSLGCVPQESLSKFSVPETVTSIGKEFFYGWKQLKELYIPKTVTLDSPIFKDNDSLTKLSCGSNNILSLFYNRSNYYGPITDIESNTMYVVEKKNHYTYHYYIPNSLTEIHLLNGIDSECLYKMQSIKKVYLPDDIISFSGDAFYGCSELTDIYFLTDEDWNYYYRPYYGTSSSGTISMNDMNNSKYLAQQIRLHNSSYDSWCKKSYDRH